MTSSEFERGLAMRQRTTSTIWSMGWKEFQFGGMNHIEKARQLLGNKFSRHEKVVFSEVQVYSNCLGTYSPGRVKYSNQEREELWGTLGPIWGKPQTP